MDQVGHPEALRWIPSLPAASTLDEHLNRSFQQIREFLADISPDLIPALSAATSLQDLHTLQQNTTVLDHLRTTLSPTVFEQVRVHVSGCNSVDRTHLLQDFAEAVDSLREQFGHVDFVTLDLLLRHAERQPPSRDRPALATVPERIAISHNWIDEQRARATLVFTQPDPGVQYGYLRVPLAIERTGLPALLNLRLRWDIKRETVRGGMRGEASEVRWPDEWPKPEPTELQIPVFKWQRVEGDRYQYPFEGIFPVRVPQSSPKLEVKASAIDVESGEAIVSPTPLRWEAISTQPIRVTMTWRDETSPQYVREHPIGPQMQAQTILERLNGGGSFAAVAPRRFGKSTLVEYLIAEGSNAGMFISPAIVCTMFAGSSGVDYQRLWAWVHDRLHEKLGSGLPREWSGPLPGETAFDQVRRAARQQGFKAIVLLFDEAQILFPRHQGWEIGSTLKTLLERHWARTGDVDKVPLLVGLIGLPSLLQRAGADVMAVLNPIERVKMDEPELRPLIARIAPRLETTRAARSRLAGSAGNLLVLRAMLEGLTELANSQQRVWINYDDVVAVEDALRRDLQGGRQEHVASFVRDVLNGADRVEDWQPNASFPVAAALAHVRTRGRPLTEAIDRTTEILNQWCQANSDDTGIRAVYSDAIVRRHVQQLEEQQVTNGNEFSSRLLESWLQGIAIRNLFDQQFRAALFRGAQRQIMIPAGAECVGAGGEATIWRKDSTAFRVRPLKGDKERTQFEDSIEMIGALKDIAERAEVGSSHIFRLIDMGLSARNAYDAVQVYRWVNGADLASAQGTFAVDFVVDIGVKLARGLRLLHRSNIIHRDVCPRNIVLDSDSDSDEIRPVLIDFGFARLASVPMSTVLTGDHFPSEVRGSKPLWTRAADIYSLAWTLKWLSDAGDTALPVLATALEGALDESPDRRPTADQFLRQLEELEETRNLDLIREQAWNQITQAARPDQHSPWFSPILRSAKPVLVAMSIGFYRTGPERMRELSDFLNRIAENSPDVKRIKRLRAANDVRQLDPISVVVALRNARVHAGLAETEDNRIIREAFERLGVQEQRDVMREAIKVVAARCRVASLSAILEPLL